MTEEIFPSHDRGEVLEQLIEHAGTMTEQPPPPKGGIPRQWMPAVIRWPVRVCMLPFVWLDLFAQKIARKIIKPPYREEGGCMQRGNCCHFILMPEPKGLIKKLYFIWNTQINGFYLRDPEPVDSEGHKLVVMGCRYLQKDGRCGQYRLRPQICREWPLIEYGGRPRILKGCGFKAVSRQQPKRPPEEHGFSPPTTNSRLRILK